MTIDEAISHAEEVAEHNDNLIRWGCINESVTHNCRECAAEHRQLAEWLRELRKAKRLLGEALRTLNDGSCNKDCRQCKWNNNGCDYGCRFDWKYGDEVSALIGETNDEP